jgi:hypothetical protein
MTSHQVRTVCGRFVKLLVVAALGLAGSRASAQFLADGPSPGWDEEHLPVLTATDGESFAAGPDSFVAAGPDSFAVVCDESPHAAALNACAPCDPGGPCATWRWRAEALALWRSSPRDRPLFSFVDGDTVAGTALDAGQLVSDPLAAPRLSLFRDDGCGPILEASYLWAGNFYSQRALPFVENGYATSPPGIYGNTWGPPDTALNAAQATLLANLQTAELNIRERFLHGLAQFIVGFRWLQWNESLQMQDSYDTVTELGPVFGVDRYRTDCFNNLYGGQIGIDAVLLGSQSGFRVDGLVKAGAFYNDAAQRSTYAYADTSPFEFAAANRNDSPDGAAFVGEVGMTAVIPVRCNLDLRVGYFGLWIEGLAQPTNQLSKQTLTQIDPPSGTLDTTGGVLLQGLSLGLEGRW